MAAYDDSLNKLMSLVEKIAIEKHQHVKACGICTSPEHSADMCPTLQEPLTEYVIYRGFFRQQQRDMTHSPTPYNPRWKDHRNMSYAYPVTKFYDRNTAVCVAPFIQSKTRLRS
ncbi:UNVERIFIED_CONTAM: hypothetical protein Slati_0976400 [Sesamum latifolium]|uniref:Uncharacterized protein n=1 Tax=Sesamum latifolium TaxID=2727402 RepID=A0AAW2XQE0_9LAMI